MKLFLIAAVVILVITAPVLAQSAKQNAALEQEVRKLDLANAEAVLRGDLATLDKLWAEELTVNSPNNKVTRGGKTVLELVRSGAIKYSSYVPEIESVLIHGNAVIVMGREMVIRTGTPDAGQTVRRRYTNIWMKRKGRWLLTARHASVICQD